MKKEKLSLYGSCLAEAITKGTVLVRDSEIAIIATLISLLTTPWCLSNILPYLDVNIQNSTKYFGGRCNGKNN